MKEWYQNLAPRERTILAGGALLAIVIVFWGLVWKPLVDQRARYTDDLDVKTRLLADLERASRIAAAPSTAAGGARQSLLIVIDSSARTFGLAEAFTQTRPNGPNEISVSFQRAPFDMIIAWLVELERTHGITVTSASMTGAGQPGLINGQVFLARG